jgi:phenylalanine-4-hydroxylase
MVKQTSYASKVAGPDGRFDYSEGEQSVWTDLFTAQMERLQHHACQSYLTGQSLLEMTADEVPQVVDVDAKLKGLTGAGVKAVDALIPQNEFSTLLSNRKFPVATFIRRREHIEYIEEPDIFHECFGHCPMLTDEAFCQFMERFGRLALDLDKSYTKRLFRLFWFTVEFGLIREDGELKAFGAGLMSSPSELANAMSDDPEILPFDLMTVLRTDYRIDIVQPVYFVIDSFEALVAALDVDIRAALDEATRKGDLPPRFPAAA